MIIKLNPEKMIKNYGENVYNKVSELTGVKFKAQINQSGIVLKELYKIINLVSNKSDYYLITNAGAIKFNDTDEFIQLFIDLIIKSINQLNSDDVENRKRENESVVDETFIHLEFERIGFCGSKQIKLLEKFRSLRKVIPNVNE